MIIGLICCTSDITQLVGVCGMSDHLSAQGAFVCFVVHIVCQVDVIAYSLVLLAYLQFCSHFFFLLLRGGGGVEEESERGRNRAMEIGGGKGPSEGHGEGERAGEGGRE